jgi:hypothetical protein
VERSTPASPPPSRHSRCTSADEFVCFSTQKIEKTVEEQRHEQMPTLAAQGVLLLLAAACFMANASSSDDSKSIVMVESEPYVQLNTEKHLAAVDDTDIWLVEFFSPMCGSCTDFKSTWAEVSSALNGQVSGFDFRFPCFLLSFVIIVTPRF